jgi:carbonic anhydrase/acetyltransferase-like protein (isoleucine patch superfamily)
MPLYALGGERPDLPADGRRSWIAPNATLIGKVWIGEEASIWFGAVLRGDNEPIAIGPRTNVQDLVLMHTDPGFPVTVGSDCTIGHRAIVHGASVGDGSLVGMGAIVLNGARIGRQCLIAAGALVREGMEIPDGSLVAGVPGRIVRSLDDAAIAMIAHTAEDYVRNGARFRAGLAGL